MIGKWQQLGIVEVQALAISLPSPANIPPSWEMPAHTGRRSNSFSPTLSLTIYFGIFLYFLRYHLFIIFCQFLLNCKFISHIYIYISIYIYIHKNVIVYVYVCVYVCIYIYIFTHSLFHISSHHILFQENVHQTLPHMETSSRLG